MGKGFSHSLEQSFKEPASSEGQTYYLAVRLQRM